MRRKDREITEKARIDEIIQNCHCCRIGFNDDGKIYIVPLSFGIAEKAGKRIFYFHSAKEGRKLELIRRSPYVGFEMDTGYELIRSASACSFSAKYQSVIGNGEIFIVDNETEKRMALQKIVNHSAGQEEPWEFDRAMTDAVCVLKLVVDTLSCKEHK